MAAVGGGLPAAADDFLLQIEHRLFTHSTPCAIQKQVPSVDLSSAASLQAWIASPYELTP